MHEKTYRPLNSFGSSIDNRMQTPKIEQTGFKLIEKLYQRRRTQPIVYYSPSTVNQ